jgi:hypothetical protein
MYMKKKNWDASDMASQLHSMIREMNSPYNDGFTSWNVKQDLYLIKFIVDEAMKDSPDFGEMEKDFLKEQEKKRIIKILKE